MSRFWDKSKPPRGPFAFNRDCPQAGGMLCWYPHGLSGRTYVPDMLGSLHLAGSSGVPTRSWDGAPAVSLASGSSQSFSSSTLPVTGFPMTLAAWARPATAHVGVIMGLGASDGASGNNRKVLYWNSDSTIHMRNQVAGSAADIAAAGAGSAGAWLHGAAVFAGSNDYRVFRNGANKNTSSTSISWGSPVNTLIGYDNAVTTYFNGDVGECAIWNVALSDDLVWRLYDPSTRFELWYPLRSRKWFSAPAGGSTLNATLVEAAAGADILSASAILAASLVDAAASIDVSSVTATRNATLTDAAAGDDLRSALSTLVASLVESAAGVDIASTSSAVSASLLEGVSAVDLASAVATLNAQLTDGVSAADLLTASMVASVAATEAAAGVDIANTGAIGTRSLVESAAAADVLSAAATLVVQVLEAGAGVDQLTAAQQLVVLLTESAAGTDLASGTKPATYSVTVVELVAALDVLSGVLASGLTLVPSRSRGVDYVLALPGVDYQVQLGVDCYPA